MPTIALINGHAFAGGLMTAMMHDYRLMNPDRGFLCLNELDFGAPLLPPMASIFRQKLPSPTTYRAMVLEAKRFDARDALEQGIIDGLAGGGGIVDDALRFAVDANLPEKAKSGVYGRLKMEMWRETVACLDDAATGDRVTGEDVLDRKRREREAERRVKGWEEEEGSKIAKSNL